MPVTSLKKKIYIHNNNSGYFKESEKGSLISGFFFEITSVLYLCVFLSLKILIHFEKVISEQDNKWKMYIILKIEKAQDISNIFNIEHIQIMCVCIS